MSVQFKTLDDKKTFIEEASSALIAQICDLQKQDANKIVKIGLSGGSTPGPIYEQVAKCTSIDWKRVKFFLIDERYVPHTSADSLQKLVHDTIQSHHLAEPLPIVHPNTTTSASVQEATQAYASLLQQEIGFNVDLAILGMGPDGHIASLFPPVQPELVQSKELAVHTTTTRFAVFDRITVSFWFLMNQAKQCKYYFFMTGAEKKQVWDQMMATISTQKLDHASILQQYPASSVILQQFDTTVYYF